MLLWREARKTIVCELPDGTKIEIYVAEFSGKYQEQSGRTRPTRVLLGINAPKTIKVDREEIAIRKAIQSGVTPAPSRRPSLPQAFQAMGALRDMPNEDLVRIAMTHAPDGLSQTEETLFLELCRRVDPDWDERACEAQAQGA